MQTILTLTRFDLIAACELAAIAGCFFGLAVGLWAGSPPRVRSR